MASYFPGLFPEDDHPLVPPRDEDPRFTIVYGSDLDEDYTEKVTRLDRREKIAWEYIAKGQTPFIQSAALKGPFETGWRNPWLDTPIVPSIEEVPPESRIEFEQLMTVRDDEDGDVDTVEVTEMVWENPSTPVEVTVETWLQDVSELPTHNQAHPFDARNMTDERIEKPHVDLDRLAWETQMALANNIGAETRKANNKRKADNDWLKTAPNKRFREEPHQSSPVVSADTRRAQLSRSRHTSAGYATALPAASHKDHDGAVDNGKFHSALDQPTTPTQFLPFESIAPLKGPQSSHNESMNEPNKEPDSSLPATASHSRVSRARLPKAVATEPKLPSRRISVRQKQPSKRLKLVNYESTQETTVEAISAPKMHSRAPSSGEKQNNSRSDARLEHHGGSSKTDLEEISTDRENTESQQNPLDLAFPSILPSDLPLPAHVKPSQGKLKRVSKKSLPLDCMSSPPSRSHPLHHGTTKHFDFPDPEVIRGMTQASLLARSACQSPHAHTFPSSDESILTDSPASSSRPPKQIARAPRTLRTPRSKMPDSHAESAANGLINKEEADPGKSAQSVGPKKAVRAKVSLLKKAATRTINFEDMDSPGINQVARERDILRRAVAAQKKEEAQKKKLFNEEKDVPGPSIGKLRDLETASPSQQRIELQSKAGSERKSHKDLDDTLSDLYERYESVHTLGSHDRADISVEHYAGFDPIDDQSQLPPSEVTDLKTLPSESETTTTMANLSNSHAPSLTGADHHEQGQELGFTPDRSNLLFEVIVPERKDDLSSLKDHVTNKAPEPSQLSSSSHTLLHVPPQVQLNLAEMEASSTHRYASELTKYVKKSVEPHHTTMVVVDNVKQSYGIDMKDSGPEVELIAGSEGNTEKRHPIPKPSGLAHNDDMRMTDTIYLKESPLQVEAQTIDRETSNHDEPSIQEDVDMGSPTLSMDDDDDLDAQTQSFQKQLRTQIHAVLDLRESPNIPEGLTQGLESVSEELKRKTIRTVIEKEAADLGGSLQEYKGIDEMEDMPNGVKKDIVRRTVGGIGSFEGTVIQSPWSVGPWLPAIHKPSSLTNDTTDSPNLDQAVEDEFWGTQAYKAANDGQMDIAEDAGSGSSTPDPTADQFSTPSVRSSPEATFSATKPQPKTASQQSGTPEPERPKTFRELMTPSPVRKHTFASQSQGPSNTQQLFEAAIGDNNPWASSSRKIQTRQKSNGKRVSFGQLRFFDSESETLEHETAKVDAPRRLASPSPPPEAHRILMEEDRFKGLLKGTPQGKPIYKTLPNPSQRSPEFSAMAEAFLEFDSGRSRSALAPMAPMFDSSNNVETQSPFQTLKRLPRVISQEVSPPHLIDANGGAFTLHGEMEALGDVVGEMGSFLEGWNVDDELDKARKEKAGRRVTGEKDIATMNVSRVF